VRTLALSKSFGIHAEMQSVIDTPFPGELGVVWVLIIAVITAIVHIGFAIAVLIDPGLMWRHLRRKTVLVGAGMWAIATLLGGVWTAAIYWLLHHSTLCPPLQSVVSHSQEGSNEEGKRPPG
jgi:hypothetical protein